MSSQWREEEAREGDGLEGEEEEDGQQFKDREHLVFLIDAGPEMCADKIVTTTGMPPQSSLSIVVLTAADFMRKRIASGYSKDEFAVIFYNTRETDNPSLHKHVHVFTPRAQPKAAAIQALQRLVTEAEFDTRVGSWAPAVGDMDGAREAADTLKNALWTVMDSLQGGGSIKAAQHRIFMFSNTEDPLAGLPAGQDREEYWRKVLYRAEALHNMRATLRFFPIAAAVHPFAMATFWDALMAPLRDPDDDYTPTPLPAAPAGVPSTLSLGAEAVIERLGRLGEYMQRCLQRRRVSATLKWCLGEGLELSCQVFDLFVTATTPWSVKLRAQDNALLMRVTSRVNEATGALVERVEHKMLVPKGKSQGRFPMVVFKKSELAAITHCLPVGLRLLGFRPRADLLDYHNMTHSSFLRPTERLVQGSTALFRALLDSMARKRVLALCSYVRTPVSHPCLVALLPQREEVDDAGYQVWAEGMHMVRLPFKDDVRSPETDPTQVGPQPLVSADEAAVDAAAAVVAALRYQDLSLGEVPNPALERHFRILEAIALGDDAEPEPAADGTLPPDDINILAGPLLDALRAATGLDVQEAPGAKRKAPAADLPTSEAYALQDWAKLARDGKLEKLSNDTLKVYLKFHRLKLTGKKAELLDRIRTHMGTSAGVEM